MDRLLKDAPSAIQLGNKTVTYSYETWASNVIVSTSLLWIIRLYNVTNMPLSFTVELLSILVHLYQVSIRDGLQVGSEAKVLVEFT